jgi:hypothetical protein
MGFRTARLAPLCVVLMASASSALAQPARPRDATPVHVGALGINPTLSITNLGLDTNVFYSPDTPESDYTATVSPATEIWLRTGRAQLEASSRVDAVFFKQFADQGTFSAANSGRVEFALNRFHPYITGSFLHVNDRPDAVIDARVQRTEALAGVGTTFKLTPKVFLTASAQGSTVGFSRKGSPVAATLDDRLKRTVLVTSAGFQYVWSPLTTMLLDVQQERTRFANAGERNATGLRITPGLDLKPRALISGRVRVGFFRYRADAAQIPGFTGMAASVDVRSRLLGNTIAGEFGRELFYAADSDAYYLQTRFGIGATRQLNRDWSVTGGVSELLLSYSAPSTTQTSAPGLLQPADVRSPGAASASASSPAAGSSSATEAALLAGSTLASIPALTPPAGQVVFVRPDRVITATGGVSLRVTPTVGFGFAGMFAHRSAVLPSGRYSDVRLMANVTYAVR